MNELVDTSVWIDHFRNKNKRLIFLLKNDLVVIHPFIIGEIACGNLKNRDEILPYLEAIPTASLLSINETLIFLEKFKLFGKGLGFIDIHLLASAKIDSLKLFTLDKKLHQESLKIKCTRENLGTED